MTGVITSIMASSGLNILFTKLDKFDGTNNDLQLWLRNFKRCCTIAGKSAEDDLVKGQLLVLCLTGQALAVVEQLEEEKKSQQNFPDLTKRLEDVFPTSADMETKMAEFEQHIQLVTES